MISHKVKVYPSKIHLPKKNQLAWKIAEIASDNAKLDKAAIEMVINRIIDNASVAIASLNRKAVISSREMALKHPRKNGANLFGIDSKLKFDCEWAAWSNGTAVRELDFHDTFLAEDYSHPGDNIPPILSVAQQTKKSGLDLLRGIITGYEVQVNLVKGICLHKHKIDHIAHLGPSVAAGLGTMLKLNTETIYQAVQQALHTTVSTRQSRKGEISSWKAYAPAHAGKLAIEAVDRAMRGEGAPSPIYEGEDSVIARILDGKKALYNVPLPKKKESKKAILETYTKEYSAEYQSQALIDIAKKCEAKIAVLHILEEENLDENQKEKQQMLKEIFEGVNYSFHELGNNSIESAINIFIESRDSDMVAFINKKHTFFGSILRQPLVKEMGFNSKVPILVMHDLRN